MFRSGQPWNLEQFLGPESFSQAYCWASDDWAYLQSLKDEVPAVLVVLVNHSGRTGDTLAERLAYQAVLGKAAAQLAPENTAMYYNSEVSLGDKFRCPLLHIPVNSANCPTPCDGKSNVTVNVMDSLVFALRSQNFIRYKEITA